MKNTRRLPAITTLLAGCLSLIPALPAAAQIYTYELLAETRSGFTDLSLFPSINNAGTVAFRAEMAAGMSGIFTANGGAPQQLIGNTGSFADFGTADPKINAAGDIVFFANLSGGGSGIFLRNGGGIISTIADTGAEFSAGDAFAVFGTPSINNSGTVAFSAGSLGGQLGVFTTTAGGTPSRVDPATTFAAVAGEVYINGNGRVGVVATTAGGATQVLTALPPADFNVAISTDGPLFSAIESVSPYLTSDGLSVVFLGTREDTGERGIFRVTGSDVTTLVDSSGGFQDFNDFALASDGTLLAFSAVTDLGQLGIFTGDDPLLDRVVATGDLLLLGSELREVNGLSFGDAGLNDAGQLTFYASFSDDPLTQDPGFAAVFRASPVPEPGVTALLAFSAVTDLGQLGIFTGDDPLLNRVVVTGDLLLFGSELREVNGLSFGDAGLNDAGQLTFYASFSDDPLTQDPGFAAVFRASPVPEPGVTALLAAGGIALLLRLRRSRRM